MTNPPKTIKGTAGDDILQGTDADDLLKGLAGNDQIFGKAGNDKLRGGNGDDELNGGAGNDQLSGGNGNDELSGGKGNDVLSGGAGDDRLIGGAGNDKLIGGAGNNEILGGGGYDTAFYNTAKATGPITFKYAFINNPPSRINPFPLPTAGFQVVREDGGVDTLSGVEQITGVAHQANTVDFSARRPFGDRGGTRGFLQAPSIEINLGKGELKILKDESTGRNNPGQRLLDAVTPKTVKLRNFANVVGSAGEDRIVGNGKANRLEGGNGDDVIIGGGGNDTLIGGGNRDTLTGGGGSDKFVLTEFVQFIRSGPDVVTFLVAGGSADTITDFEQGDQIQLRQADNFWGRGFDDLALGTIGAEQFAVEGQDEITAATKLIYNGSSGELFYKPNDPVRNPNPRISEPLTRVKVATLSGAPSLQASDFAVI